MKTFFLSVLSFLLLLSMGCQQDTPPAPQDQEGTPAQDSMVMHDYPPPILDTIDRSGWESKGYGTNPVYVATPLPFITTKESIPESAAAFIQRRETYSGVFENGLQVIVNIMEYKPKVPVSLAQTAASVVEQMTNDPAITEFESYNTAIPLDIQGLAMRQDGKMFKDGTPTYWCNMLIQRGQEIFQLMAIYPAGSPTGTGDVEAMMSSIRFSAE
ncbi:MAG: hypothetical protein H6568_08450 [Lewinellaceae bacterium]|nr:hypothetical protein [Saprospiraceae bacterium]MCB9312784.1 hypothetical protein [Lewinellaceae bacterium]HRW74701.1 hypothetical protein [Saprospiraceae bacterium]